MTKLRLLGAALALSSTLSVPATAQQVIVDPGYYAHSAYCRNKEPGNPYTPQNDYQHWSAWRAEGSWDTRGDWSCRYDSRLQFGF